MTTRCWLVAAVCLCVGLLLWTLFPRVETRTVTERVPAPPETVYVDTGSVDTAYVVPEGTAEALRDALPTAHHPAVRRVIEDVEGKEP